MKTPLRLLVPVIALTLSSLDASAQMIVGITEADEIFTITDAGAPSSFTAPRPVTGITPGQSIAGLDYRPNTGELFAMGYNYANGATQLYKVNPGTAVATAVNATPITLLLGFGSIGFDFNPTVDRIRVVGATSKKNYRLNPVNGSIAATDGDLAFAPGDPNAMAAPSVGAVAYTNSYVGAEATTLYDYDENLNALLFQNPPNNGTLNTVGPSGIMINTNNRSIDMDIYFDPIARVNRAYLVANTGPGSIDGLFSVNTTTGAASLIGAIGLPVKDIAVFIDRSIAPQNGALLYALTRTNRNLISFSATTPERVRSFSAITGVTAGQTMVGLDFRPADGKLYGLGYNSSNKQYQLYSINTDNGAATAINGTSDSMNLGSNVNAIGFDFNPTVDRIRVVSGTTRANYRLNPTTGAIAATDSMLQWAPADSNASLPVRIGSVAYTNSYKGTTTTQLFGLSDTAGIFVLINPPNNGTLNTVAKSNILLNATDLSIDMDFYYDSVSASNIGYLAANRAGAANDSLYTFSTMGGVMQVNTIGLGIPIADIAAKPSFTNAGTSLNVVSNAVATSSVVVFPNPATDLLQVAFPTAMGRDGRYQIMDISGRVLQQGSFAEGASQARISIAGLAAGNYFLKFGATGNSFTPARFTKL